MSATYDRPYLVTRAKILPDLSRLPGYKPKPDVTVAFQTLDRPTALRMRDALAEVAAIEGSPYEYHAYELVSIEIDQPKETQ